MINLFISLLKRKTSRYTVTPRGFVEKALISSIVRNEDVFSLVVDDCCDDKYQLFMMRSGFDSDYTQYFKTVRVNAHQCGSLIMHSYIPSLGLLINKTFKYRRIENVLRRSLSGNTRNNTRYVPNPYYFNNV